VTSVLGDPLRNLGVQLAYKMAAFTDSASLFASADAFDRVPPEDVGVSLYQSPSIREEFYSAVIVLYDGMWFKVYGYDVLVAIFQRNTPERVWAWIRHHI
jgi:hypothetical protein